MKPRARRVTLSAAVIGAGVLGFFVVAYWGTVRDHVEAWWFQFTRETFTIRPKLSEELPVFVWSDRASARQTQVTLWGGSRVRYLEHSLQALAAHSGTPVVIEAGFQDEFQRHAPASLGPMKGGTPIQAMEEIGYRVLEQRFPRRAYVVLRDERHRVMQSAP